MKIIKNGLNIFIQLIKFVFITFGIAFGLLFLISLYLDSWMTRRVQRKSYPSAATATLATIAKECAQKKADGQINPTFSISKLEHYFFSPANDDCSGDANNL